MQESMSLKYEPASEQHCWLDLTKTEDILGPEAGDAPAIVYLHGAAGCRVMVAPIQLDTTQHTEQRCSCDSVAQCAEQRCSCDSVAQLRSYSVAQCAASATGSLLATGPPQGVGLSQHPAIVYLHGAAGCRVVVSWCCLGFRGWVLRFRV